MPEPQQSDPFEQAAKDYHAGGNIHAAEGAPASGGDDWKVWQDGEAKSPSMFDEKPDDNAFQTMGKRAVNDLRGMMAHPIDSITSGLRSSFGTDDSEVHEDPDGHIRGRIGMTAPPSILAPYKGEGMAKGLEHAAGDLGAGLLTGKLLGGVGKLAEPIKAAGAGIDNAVIGTPSSASRFGANPGAALSSNRIVGSTPASLAEGIQEKIPGAAAEHRGIVQQNQGGKMINTGPLVSDPFETRMSAGTDPRTGAAAPTQIKAAGKTLRGLTHVPDEMTGEATPNMRDPNLSPLEATQLKSNLYPRINYEQPSRFSISNDSLRGAAHNLKTAVDTAVPESVEAGQRLHNLMSAKDIIEPSARSGKMLPTSKSGLIDRGVMLAGTGAGAGLDALGSAVPNISRYLQPLPLMATSRKDR